MEPRETGVGAMAEFDFDRQTPTERPVFRPGTRAIEEDSGRNYVYGLTSRGYEWVNVDEPIVKLKQGTR